MDTVADLPPEEAVEAVKVCEETLRKHVEKFAVLKNMVSEIANAVGLDEKSLLNSEIDDLGKRLENVRKSLTILSDVAEEQYNQKAENEGKINETRDLIQAIKSSVNGISSNADNDEQKLTDVRDNLLALGKAESHIQLVRNKTLELSQTVRTETTVLEVLELWQEVFKETFQQYHRLSSRLVKNEDAAAALRLWQEYLVNVQQFLQGSIPSDYYSLSDHQHLCQVHKNLLTTQQNILQPLDQNGQLASGLVENSVLEQFNTLTSLHNETLDSIVQRYTEVQNRINSWERYRTDQNRLHAWLKDIEREKERMQLRYLHIRGINRVISQIDTLLSKIPYGEDQLTNLIEQQQKILQFGDDALSTSIRMEHAALKQRISNLQASLMTWKQFLERISKLVQSHEERVSKLDNIYNNTQDIISDFMSQSSTNSSISNRLGILQTARLKLANTSSDLEDLESSQKQLKECLSPSDIKGINQKMWVLKNQRNELDHELLLLCQQIEEKLGQRSQFEDRHAKFIAWADDLERKILRDSDMDSPVEDLKELSMKLETKLQADMALKHREYNWLITTGNSLVSSCGEQYSDVTAKQILHSKTNEVKLRWEKLDTLGKSQIDRLNSKHDLITQLERKIAEIRAWLTQMEIQLGKPLIFENCSKEILNRKIQEHEELKKSIESESGILAEVANLCELLLNDEDAMKSNCRYRNLSAAIEHLEKRWKKVCEQSTERKRNISFAWQLLHEINELSESKESWIVEMENKLKLLEKPTGQLVREELQNEIFKLEKIIKELETEAATFTILESTYSKAVTLGGLQPDNIQELTSRCRIVITKWNNLLPKANAMLQSLQKEIALFKEFEVAQGDSIVALAGIDSRLTTLQHLTDSKQTPQERLKLLNAIETDLNNQNSTLQIADELGLKIMKKGNREEIEKTQKMIDEYQFLWKEIQERIIILTSEITTLIEQSLPQEVDECVQVETLKFEQDTAVQVNTLHPQLQRMTSISAKDAYLVELETAIADCKTNQEKLKGLLDKETPPQGSQDLSLRSKEIVKLLACCQSNVEVVNHLHRVLVEECDSTSEEAMSTVVDELNETYEELLMRSKQMQQKIRELRSAVSDAYNLLCEHEAGRLICPLCTKRNWAQLDNDLWRLEKWLEIADGTQKEQRKPPSNIEQLEDVIQDHREFVLDLDSHKSIIRSLNIVGTHLADHSEDTDRADKLRSRLEEDNKTWDLVCRRAASWERLLQTALIENQQFHSIINELCAWLEKTEQKIKLSEPVDLTVDASIIESKYQAFRELRSELERCEPRVMSLQEAANQLLRQEDSPEGSSTTYRRLTDLRLKLQSLIKLTGVYILKLGAVIGRDPSELGVPLTSSTLGAPSLSGSYDLLDGSSERLPPSTAHDDTAHTDGTDDELQINPSVLRRGCSFLGRVLRASIPIQAVMLLLLGAALVPFSEDDDSCSLYTSIANSLSPVLRYNGGPPPV
ncbi:nesprin-1-like isoform X2 [Coccinella septempunctata]|uniref:nesprin-1-like isoform X2 n=1 Tax=Coccinella septempunctata TaxID=41139 RepID=UPI001D09057A|nr:nesprin-1-like isoform X2 [Coccinella septempunctata]